MSHSIGDMKYKRTLAIAALLLVSALIAVYGFNVSWGRSRRSPSWRSLCGCMRAATVCTAVVTVGRATIRTATSTPVTRLPRRATATPECLRRIPTLARSRPAQMPHQWRAKRPAGAAGVR